MCLTVLLRSGNLFIVLLYMLRIYGPWQRYSSVVKIFLLTEVRKYEVGNYMLVYNL